MATHGSTARFFVNGIDVSAYADSVASAFERETADVTTFGEGSKQYIPGLKDASIPFDGPMHSETADLLYELYADGDIFPFEYWPSGTAIDQPHYSGFLFVSAIEISSEVSDPNALSGGFQITGDVERAAFLEFMDFNDDDGVEFLDFNSDDPDDDFVDWNVA